MVTSQVELDAKCTELKTKMVKMANLSAQLRRQGDSDALRLEHELMLLQNTIYVLDGYLISYDILLDEDIRIPIELALQVTSHWPKAFIKAY